MKAFPFVVMALVLAVSGCGGDSNSIPTAPSRNVAFSTVDLRVGTGAEAATGRNVVVNYSGWVYDPAGTDNKGSRFDAGTYPFTVGTGVIPGFSQGVVGMKVGGLRRVTIPPNLGYGNNPPSGSIIRANETLIFEIELVSVQ
jgi:FKBP-type peptidyl-prolyl cis-trans isomerase FkpA